MAGGSFTTGTVSKERAEQYKGRVTAYVIISCIVAATGGALFGYDIGISGSSIIHTMYLSCFPCSGSFIFHTLNEKFRFVLVILRVIAIKTCG